MTGLLPIVVAAVLIVLAIASIAYAGWTFLNPTRTASDRLREYTGDHASGNEDAVMAAVAERVGALAASKDMDQRAILRTKLIQAGYRSKRAPEVFNALRVGLALVLPLLVVPVAGLLGKYIFIIGAALILAAIGYYAPLLAVNNTIAKRQKTLMKPFPDALDLLVSSVEAGLGMDAAFQRVADELTGAAPELGQEFQLVNHEISAGVSRVDALKHLEKRTGLDQVKSLVNMLTQAERFGTSIARSLRVHSHIAREKRMAMAEEEAAKISPKLTVIMILFLLPTLMVVLLGPALIRIYNEFINK